jgi:hypothetical protein
MFVSLCWQFRHLLAFLPTSEALSASTVRGRIIPELVANGIDVIKRELHSAETLHVSTDTYSQKHNHARDKYTGVTVTYLRPREICFKTVLLLLERQSKIHSTGLQEGAFVARLVTEAWGCNPDLVVSVCTDNASDALAAGREFVRRIPAAVQMGCSAHKFALVCKYACKVIDPSLTSLLEALRVYGKSGVLHKQAALAKHVAIMDAYRAEDEEHQNLYGSSTSDKTTTNKTTTTTRLQKVVCSLQLLLRLCASGLAYCFVLLSFLLRHQVKAYRH